ATLAAEVSVAKFQVGDLVDVRLEGEVKRGWCVTEVFHHCFGVLTVSYEARGLRCQVMTDDVMPHVPAPVVPPAPVDPLTGLTAAEMERRYSARLTAFGRGDADPFAAPR